MPVKATRTQCLWGGPSSALTCCVTLGKPLPLSGLESPLYKESLRHHRPNHLRLALFSGFRATAEGSHPVRFLADADW